MLEFVLTEILKKFLELPDDTVRARISDTVPPFDKKEDLVGSLTTYWSNNKPTVSHEMPLIDQTTFPVWLVETGTSNEAQHYLGGLGSSHLEKTSTHRTTLNIITLDKNRQAVIFLTKLLYVAMAEFTELGSIYHVDSSEGVVNLPPEYEDRLFGRGLQLNILHGESFTKEETDLFAQARLGDILGQLDDIVVRPGVIVTGN